MASQSSTTKMYCLIGGLSFLLWAFDVDIVFICSIFGGLPGSSVVVKNLPSNAGDVGSMPGLRRSPGEGNSNHSSILAWEMLWREEPGGLQSMGSHRVGHD